jgi:hypothetical protein
MTGELQRAGVDQRIEKQREPTSVQRQARHPRQIGRAEPGFAEILAGDSARHELEPEQERPDHGDHHSRTEH